MVLPEEFPVIRFSEFFVSLSCLVFAACGGTVIADDGIGGQGTSQNDDGNSDDGTSDDGNDGNAGGGFAQGGSSTSVSPVGSGGFGGSAMTSASGGGGPVLLIECGNTFCEASFEECCVTFGMGQAQTSCVPQNSCPGSSFDCSSASSCENGQVCCLQPAGMMRFESTCQDACMGGPNGQGVQLCESSSECLNMEPCEGTPLGLDVCGGFGPN